MALTMARFLGVISILVVLTAIDTAEARQPDEKPGADTPQSINYSPAANVHITPMGPVPALANPAGGAPPSNVSYQGGSVQQSLAAYTIFWDPGGTISSSYRDLINRYFQDIGGSSFYNIVSQYYQLPGPTFVENISTLGGTWIDTSPYPDGKGTVSNPLSDLDIEAEVTRALGTNPDWNPAGVGKTYFVYTDPGVESCIDPTAGFQMLACTWGISAAQHYCGYHAYFGATDNPVIYANMPYGQTWNFDCQFTLDKFPNGDIAADKEISLSSHEQFEAVTDPLLNAWFDSGTHEEIADKCTLFYGSIMPDGHNLVLNGHPYIAQLEWSNASSDGVTPLSGCVKAYGGAGDASCDGNVNVEDVVAVLSEIGQVHPGARCADLADVDCDGTIDGADALRILDYVAGTPLAQPSGCQGIGTPVR